ncbi:MAG: dihydrofolate reductase [Rhizobiaceae bacterium]|nr:dihydrofolate reductase [Rhizobiaceae bacterium]
MKIVIHVAISRNGIIGRDGDLPWRLSTDMRRFKAATMGKPVVMGRKTWQSFPRRPLPGRANIVVTRNPDFQDDGAIVAHSLEEAISLARNTAHEAGKVDEICVIGGGEIYAQAIDLADELHVTHVLADVEGDARFPAIDPVSWEAVTSEDVPAGEKDSHPTRHVVYRRRGLSR